MPLYCRKAAAILSVSQLTTDIYNKLFKLPPGKVKTVYFGPGEHFHRVEAESTRQRVVAKYGLPKKFILTLQRYGDGGQKISVAFSAPIRGFTKRSRTSSSSGERIARSSFETTTSRAMDTGETSSFPAGSNRRTFRSSIHWLIFFCTPPIWKPFRSRLQKRWRAARLPIHYLESKRFEGAGWRRRTLRGPAAVRRYRPGRSKNCSQARICEIPCHAKA